MLNRCEHLNTQGAATGGHRPWSDCGSDWYGASPPDNIPNVIYVTNIRYGASPLSPLCSCCVLHQPTSASPPRVWLRFHVGSQTRAHCGQYTNASQITVTGSTVSLRSHLFSLFCRRCCCPNHNHCRPFRPLLPQQLLQRRFSKSATSLAPPVTMCGWAKIAGCLALPSILSRRARRPSSPLMGGFFCSP